MVLQLAAKERSHGEHASSHCHELNTVLAVDTHDNHQCELRIQRAECRHVLHDVLAGRAGDSQDSATCRLAVAQSLFLQICPRGSFEPILVCHRQQRSGSVDKGLPQRGFAAHHSLSLSLEQRHASLSHSFH